MADQRRHAEKQSSTMVVARELLILLAFSLASSLALGAQSAQDGTAPQPSGTTVLRVELTGGSTKTPIVDASVYVKYTEDKLVRDKKIEFNLKTNQRGTARSPEIPKGRILIQIVAPGWKTFGQYYDVTEDERTIQINLERPSTQWLQN